MTPNDLNDNFNSTLLVDNQIIVQNSSFDNYLEITDSTQTIFFVHQQEMLPDSIQTIKSIAQACQLTEQQYVILPATCPWNKIRHYEQLKNLVLFGELEQDLGINLQFPIHYIYTFDHKTWIKTLNITSLNQDKAAKTALWNTALKKHFVS